MRKKYNPCFNVRCGESMVKGELLNKMMDYVAKKRGVAGLTKLMDNVNKKEVLFTKPEDIESDKEYPAKYFIKVFDSALEVLGDEELIRGMGTYFAETTNMGFKGITGRYPPRKSVQYMVIYAREQMPVFHTGYRSMSESTYWVRVSKISKDIYPFVDGFFVKMFEIHGGVADVKRELGIDSVKYIIKF